MNNQRVRPETNGAGNGGRERPEGVLAPTESDAVAALAANLTTEDIVKLKAMASMFVAGDGSNLLTAQEIATDVALMQTQLTTYPDQLGPGNAMCGFIYKDVYGNHQFVSLGGKDQGSTIWVRRDLANGQGQSWIRSMRAGYINPNNNNHQGSFYDGVLFAGADVNMRAGYPKVNPPPAMLVVMSDVPDPTGPGGFAILSMVATNGGDFVTGDDYAGTRKLRVDFNGSILPSDTAFVPRATGGVLSYANNKITHRFDATGNFTNATDIVADIFVLGGGGGGGSGAENNAGGGGGAGWRLLASGITIPAGTHTAVVGAGGGADSNGGTSSFLEHSAAGGGKGGKYIFHGEAGSCDGGGGACGGGGGAAGWDYTATNGGPGDPGYAGGSGYFSEWTPDLRNYSGGGGGGLGGPGGSVLPSTPQLAGAGGPGVVDTFDGIARVYGGGGGGANGSYMGTNGTRGLGGIGGGGNGGQSGVNSGNGSPGANGTGGGGGGASVGGVGGQGGSGICMIRYAAMP